jgi:hypothetical protein
MPVGLFVPVFCLTIWFNIKQLMYVDVFYHVMTKEAVYDGLDWVPPQNSWTEAQGQCSKATHLFGTYRLRKGCLNYEWSVNTHAFGFTCCADSAVMGNKNKSRLWILFFFFFITQNCLNNTPCSRFRGHGISEKWYVSALPHSIKRCLPHSKNALPGISLVDCTRQPPNTSRRACAEVILYNKRVAAADSC